MKAKIRNWNWREFVGYFLSLLVLGFGISLILIRTVKVPEEFPLSTGSPYDPFFFFGCAILMIIAPLVAGFLRWRFKEFIVAFFLATGLLLANLGSGIAFCIGAAFSYFIGTKISELIAYYLPKQTEQGADGDAEEGV